MGRDPRGTLGFGSRLTDMFISVAERHRQGHRRGHQEATGEAALRLQLRHVEARVSGPGLSGSGTGRPDALIDVLAKLSGTVITPQDDDESTCARFWSAADEGRREGQARSGRRWISPGGPPGGNGGGPPGPPGAAPMLPGMGPGNGGGEQPGAMPMGSAGPEQPKIVVNNLTPPEEQA